VTRVCPKCKNEFPDNIKLCPYCQVKTKKKGCFIATAVYGTWDHPDLDVLRYFRDRYLMSSELGSHMVFTYYTVGPFLADKIKYRKFLRETLRKILSSAVRLLQAVIY